ncbi:hypothetical protein CERSUDRAFT_93456 [Gelatoporia subvermispora B]|uniref:Uncharacterized protein n=1 Tax=Ceriporiopsis subvermispora (strain B) TaxID=914234 RepID=M2RKW5_CERS8|nr:hypothetical protein CERSUDRAFT_93456 [Gelatoporia subvermispora B]
MRAFDPSSSTLVTANAAHLRSVDFGGMVYRLLVSAHTRSPLRFPAVETLAMLHLESLPRTCAAIIFPNVRHLRVSTIVSSEPLGGQEVPIWPKLVSVEASGDNAACLARQHPAIRRMHMSVPASSLIGVEPLMEMYDLPESNNIVSAFLAFNIKGFLVEMLRNARPQRSSRPILKKSASGQNWRQRFRTRGFSRSRSEALLALFTHETMVSLNALPGLRCLSLRFVDRESPHAHEQDAVQNIEYNPSLEDVTSLYFERVPALEFLELDIPRRGWKRTWWRRQPGAQQAPHRAPRRIIRVSQEEGAGARGCFDWDGCR